MIHLTDINDFEAIGKLAEKLPEPERELFKANTGAEFDHEEFLVALAEIAGSGPYQHTLWDGDTPLAACGFIQQRPGVYRTWAVVPDSSWVSHGQEITRTFAQLIYGMLDDKLAHRIETVTLAKLEKVQAWYPRLGLRYESTLRGYGANGEDAVMYVAVRDPEKT